MIQPSGLLVPAGCQAGQDVVGGSPAFFFDQRAKIGANGGVIHSDFVKVCLGQMLLGIKRYDQ
jgi:hypothetical protein